MATPESPVSARRQLRGQTGEPTLLRETQSRTVWRRLARNRRAIAALTFLLLLYLVALLAPLTAPYDPNKQVLVDRLRAATVRCS